jgi:hypothetical protein
MGEIKSITITEEKFKDAFFEANETWKSIGEKTEGCDEMRLMLMSLQNVMFGAVLKDVLFNENKEDK